MQDDAGDLAAAHRHRVNRRYAPGRDVVFAIGLALSSGALGAFGTMWAMLRTERNRQAFDRQQDSRRLRAQTMKAARVLDSVLQ